MMLSKRNHLIVKIKDRSHSLKKTAIIIGAAIFLLAGSLGIYANNLLSEVKIYPNVYVEDVNLGGLGKEDSKLLLKSKYHVGDITFSYGNQKWTYSLKELGYDYDIDKAVEQAYMVARDNSLPLNFLEAFRLTRGGSKQIVMDKIENFAAFEPIFEEIKNQVDVSPVDAKISIGNGVNVTEEKNGLTVDQAQLSKLTEDYFKKQDQQPIAVPVQEEKPKVTAAYLRQINGVIGEYHTTFNNSIPGRNHNIRLAASRIDNVLLNPGEQFSFYQKNGAITAADGYVNAPVIVKGELQEGMGGGVCQVSSTLYNSVLLSNLTVVERRNHSIPSGYVPIGRDATVFGSLIDFKFKNDKDYPVYIRSFVAGNRVTVSIYGDVNKHPKVAVSSKVVEVIPRKIEKINDPSLPKDKEEIDKPGRDGIKSVTTLTVNGQSRVISRDYYPPDTKKIKIGTGPPVEVTDPTLDLSVPGVDPSVVIPELNVFDSQG